MFDYIERFYNPKRRHSTLGYLNPNDSGHDAAVAGWSKLNKKRWLEMR